MPRSSTYASGYFLPRGRDHAGSASTPQIAHFWNAVPEHSTMFKNEFKMGRFNEFPSGKITSTCFGNVFKSRDIIPLVALAIVNSRAASSTAF